MGKKVIDNPVYRDKLMKIQGKVIAFQSNSLRVLSAKLNKNQDVKIAGMIQKYVGTELRHELEGFAIDIMGELGTLYQNSPNLKRWWIMANCIYVFFRTYYWRRHKSNTKEYYF